MYNTLIPNDINPAGQMKWNNTLHQNITNEQWQDIYKLPIKIFIDPNLKWMQYRINQHILEKN